MKPHTLHQRLSALILCGCLLLGLLTGCGPAENSGPAPEGKAPAFTGLTYESMLPLEYAQCFQVYRYAEGHSLIQVDDGRDYLVVPEGGIIPPEAEDCFVLQQPLDTIYLAATSAMALFCAMDGLDAVRLSGSQQKSWYIEDAVWAMEEGDLIYAGKYSEPDFELLLDQGCDLAIESTMILHSPQVQEKLEELGIPVLIDRSSYENHPLARTEWIKLYAVLLDKEDEAAAFFREQAAILDELDDFPNTEKTVAFFYVTARGAASVRKSDDYLAPMIELAGGRYIFPDLGDSESKTSTMTMTMEDFYAGAREADILIYNASIDNPMNTLDELLLKSELFADFKAVREGNVWCTGKSLYQATDSLGGIIRDIHQILTDDGGLTEVTYMHKLR